MNANRVRRLVQPSALGPPLLVAAGAAALLTAFGVRPAELLRFAAYQAGMVFLPGWLLYLALSRSPRGIARQVAVGWGLGYALEIVAFIVTAALGLRRWLPVYPLLVVLLLAPLLWRRRHSLPWAANADQVPAPRRRRRRPATAAPGALPRDRVWPWVTALACLVAQLYVGVGFFAETPLPGTVPGVSYYSDLVWDMGLAAEAQHHWPITDPHVAGEPLSYYTFAFIHLAAMGQITGLPLSLILLRLYPITLLTLCVIQLYALGSGLGAGSDRPRDRRDPAHRVGVLTIVLTLLVGEIDPFRGPGYRFLHVFLADLYLSPTFLLGLVFFVPLVIELADLLGDSRAGLRRTGGWVVVALLLVGCGGAKGTILPVVVGGLGLFLAWASWTQRRLDLTALAAFGLALVTLLVFQLLVYGDSGIAPSIRPLSSLYAMEVFGKLVPRLPTSGLARAPWLAYFVTWGFVGLMGVRAVGLAWSIVSTRARFSTAEVWLWSLFLISLVPYYALGQTGESQLYFFWYGYVAACALAAQGLDGLWERARRAGVLPRVLVQSSLAALAVLGLLDLPLDNRDKLDRMLKGQPTYLQTNRNLTPGLLQAMRWVQANTDPDAVLAVNNHYSSGPNKDPRYYYYSAFSERRVFLEGWMYSNQAHRLGYERVEAGQLHPFPDRFQLNQRLFGRGDVAALQEMSRQYGVSYLLVDKVHGRPVPALDQLGTLVYTNQDADIFAVGSN